MAKTGRLQYLVLLGLLFSCNVDRSKVHYRVRSKTGNNAGLSMQILIRPFYPPPGSAVWRVDPDNEENNPFPMELMIHASGLLISNENRFPGSWLLEEDNRLTLALPDRQEIQAVILNGILHLERHDRPSSVQFIRVHQGP